MPALTQTSRDGAAFLRAERLRRGFNQRQAAQAAGVTPRVMGAAEAGVVPQPDNALKIAKFYGVDVMFVWPLDTGEDTAA